MTDDVVRRYNGARPIQAPAQLLADAIREVEVLREENARLREELKVAANFLDDAYTDIGRDEYKVAGFVARAAIREGGRDDAA